MPENYVCAYLEHFANIFCFIVRCKCCVSPSKETANREQNEFGEMYGNVYTGSDTYEIPIRLQPRHTSWKQNGDMKFACEITGTVEIEGVPRKIHGFINFLDSENKNWHSEENVSRLKQQRIFTINPVNFCDKDNNTEANFRSDKDDENIYISIYDEHEDIDRNISVHQQNMSSKSEKNLKKDYTKEEQTSLDTQEKYYQLRNHAINGESQIITNRIMDNVEVERKVTKINEPVYENIEEVQLKVNSLQTSSKTVLVDNVSRTQQFHKNDEKCFSGKTELKTKMNENHEEIDDYYSYTYEIGKHHILHNSGENSENMKHSEVVLQDTSYENLSKKRDNANAKCQCCGKRKLKDTTTLSKEEELKNKICEINKSNSRFLENMKRT